MQEIFGKIFDIERFAISDGSGIRTVVFFKGCPLRCLWCANPESQMSGKQIMYWPNRCIGCGNCTHNCPQQAIMLTDKGVVRNERCILCGHCAKICNTMALTLVGQCITVDEIIKQLEKDEEFYKETSGGITFSGGEPLMQKEFLLALSSACKARGYHTSIETSGYAEWALIDAVKEYIDDFLYDFKCMDSTRHKIFTGVDNTVILENFIRLVRSGKYVVARIPVVPGYNAEMDDMAAIADFLEKNNPGCHVDLLPYHQLGISKYQRLDIPYRALSAAIPEPAYMEKVKQMFLSRGFQVTIGG